MPNKYNKEFKNFIITTIARLQEMLYLRVYDIKVKYHNYSDGEYDATIALDIQYLRATINIFSSMVDYWKKNNKKKIEKILLHELLHIIVDEIRVNSTERSVCKLEKILWRKK